MCFTLSPTLKFATDHSSDYATNPPNDGLINTADDSLCPPASIIQPGPDGLLGTADDITIFLGNYRREVRIRDIPGNSNLRQLDVIVTYTVGRLRRTYTLTTYISSFA